MVYNHLKKFLITVSIVYCLLNFDFVAMTTGNNYQDLTFPSAQCQAVCLKTFMKNKPKRSECSEACKHMPDFCENNCPIDNTGCLDGCKYLKEILKIHPGQCPTTSASKTEQIRQPSCLSKCKFDSDCFNTADKCCSSGCNSLCTQPTLNSSVPRIPPQLKPTEVPNSSDIEFEWMSNYSEFIRDEIPLTFILQTRVCSCKVFDPTYAGKWQTLIITSQAGARLNAFDQGKMYQFRLAAVSPYGTRGYGPASKFFPDKVERPDNPAAPRGLSEILSRIYSSGQISITIGWQKPEDHVLPISEFLVKWMIDYGYVQSDGHAISALTQFTQSVPPDKVSYVLENLKANTSYRVEVYTKIFWPGDEPLVSDPVVLFLSTPAINFVKNNDIYQEDPEGLCKRPQTLYHKNDEFSADISQAFYSNGNIKVSVKVNNSKNIPATYRVTWTRKICIDSSVNPINDREQKSETIQTTNRFIELIGIRFSCRYHISVQIIDDKVPKSETDPEILKSLVLEGYFCVPSCSEVVINRNTRYPDCFDHKTNPPPQPKSLSSTMINKKDKTYKVSWNHPELIISLKEDINKSKYRIIWGPRYKEPISENLYGDITGLFPIIDSGKSNVKVLNNDSTSLMLEHLLAQTMYVVQAQLLLTLRDGQEMESDVSTHYFNTGQDNSLVEDPRGSTSCFQANRILVIIHVSITVSVVYRTML